MEHRYGRHGPRAWLRWRQRRYARPSRLPVPVAPIIVRVFIPANAERVIFIVVQQPEGFDEEERNEEEQDGGQTPPLPFPESRQVGPALSPEDQAKYEELKAWSEYEAKDRFARDNQNVQDRGAEWPLDETIERDATIKASEAIKQFINPKFDIERAIGFYVGQYTDKYRALCNGVLPNKETRQVRQLAQRDARNDKEDEVNLEEQELTCQAVLHIQELFGYRTRAVSGYLTYIMGHTPLYKQAYREEVGRSSRSHGF